VKKIGRILLILAGLLSSLVAALHILIILLGESAYRFFPGVGEALADLLRGGSALPALLTGGIALVFIAFALYAFSGARLIRRLPLLRLGLACISAIYLLRGLMNIPYYVHVLASGLRITEFHSIVYDAVSTLIGACYLAGTAMLWKELKKQVKGTQE
jgi:putative oxidoreductase